MHSRALRIAVLVFEVVWLNIIVPGHTRGIITIHSGGADSAQCPACSASDACPFCSNESHSNSSKNPTPSDRSNCAICQFMAHLTLPPVYDYRPAALKLLELLPIPQPESRASAAPTDRDHCRGPPTSVV